MRIIFQHFNVKQSRSLS